MKRLLTAAAALLLAGHLHAAPASTESVETLLEVTQVRSLLDGMHKQLEPLMRNAMQQSLQGRTLRPEEQRALDAVPARFAALLRQEMSWETLKPLYVDVYRETYDQAEIDGLIAFYRSPVGQAFVAKTPALMQKTMTLTQGRMQAIIPRLTQAIDEALREAKEAPANKVPS